MSQTLPLESPVSPVKMTFEEYLELGEDDRKSEWVDGEVQYMSATSRVHQNLGAFLIWLIDTFSSTHHLGSVFYESFVMRIGPDFPGRMPDILFVSNEHLDRVEENHLNGPADLVVEIVSRDSVRRDRVTKREEYARGGIPEYWIVDSLTRQAEFLALNDERSYEPIPLENGGIFRSRILSGFWLKTHWLWDDPRPSLLDILQDWKLIG
jgi:Uma2 family endonuclease